MNTYIQNKLDEFDKQLTTDGKGKHWSLSSGDVKNVRSFVEQSLTDYHNHIVDKFKEKYKFSSSTTLFEILSLLQDTNK